MKILVTGGLGFIGSHTVVALVEQGYQVVIVDNLSNTRREVLDAIIQLIGREAISFYQVSVNDEQALLEVFKMENPEAVIHFAAFKAVGESIAKPLLYYWNNVSGLISLLKVMEISKCRKLVFSSSATVYGNPAEVPASETTPLSEPTNPYGATKAQAERILMDIPWLQTQILRYFNPVGAHPSGLIGELPNGIPNNLMPFVTQTAAGLRSVLTVFGQDYHTKDGTCIRDFIHVMDLAEAHVASLDRLKNPLSDLKEIYNIGTGQGYSVKQLIELFMEVNGVDVPHQYGERRPGDVPIIFANPAKAAKIMGWTAKRNLTEMVRDAWNWQLTLNNRGTN